MDSVWILLQLCIIPIICNCAAYFCNCVLQKQQSNLHEHYFEQYEAPLDYFRGVQEHLDQTFPLKRIGRRAQLIGRHVQRT